MKSSPGIGSPIVVLLFVLITSLVLPRFALAEQLQPRVVAVEVAGSPEVIRATRDTATEVLGRLDVEPRVDGEGRLQSTGSAWVRAYLDLSDPRKPRLVVLDGTTQRELARRTIAGSSSIETAIESATLVLYMVLESLLSGEAERSAQGLDEARASDGASTGRRTTTGKADAAVGSSALEAPRDEAPADSQRDFESPAESPAAIRLDAGALLRMTMLDDSRSVAGAGLLAGVRAAERLGGVLFASVHFPAELSSADAAAAVTVFSSRLLLTIDVPIAARTSSVFGAGGGVDWFTADVLRTPANAVAPSSRSTLHGVLTALLGLRVSVADPILLTTAAALDFDPSPRTFTGVVAEERRPLLHLARLRPSVLIAVAFSAGSERTSRARASARGGQE